MLFEREDRRTPFTPSLASEIAVAMQRGNTAAVLGTTGSDDNVFLF